MDPDILWLCRTSSRVAQSERWHSNEWHVVNGAINYDSIAWYNVAMQFMEKQNASSLAHLAKVFFSWRYRSYNYQLRSSKVQAGLVWCCHALIFWPTWVALENIWSDTSNQTSGWWTKKYLISDYKNNKSRSHTACVFCLNCMPVNFHRSGLKSRT